MSDALPRVAVHRPGEQRHRPGAAGQLGARPGLAGGDGPRAGGLPGAPVLPDRRPPGPLRPLRGDADSPRLGVAQCDAAARRAGDRDAAGAGREAGRPPGDGRPDGHPPPDADQSQLGGLHGELVAAGRRRLPLDDSRQPRQSARHSQSAAPVLPHSLVVGDGEGVSAECILPKCLITSVLFLLFRRTQQRLGQPWGPVGVESWPPSLCIPSVSPVTCAGVIDPDYSSGSNATTSAGGADRSHRILATFINRTVSLLEFRSTGFTVVRHFGRFRMFFDCYDTSQWWRGIVYIPFSNHHFFLFSFSDRYILLLLAILLVITVVLAIIYFVYRILSQRNAAVKKGGPATSAATSATSNAESSVASSSAAASSAAVSSRQQPLSSVPGMAKVEETSKESTKQSTITKNEAKSPRSAKRSQKTSPAGRR